MKLTPHEQDIIISCLASELEAVEEHRGFIGEKGTDVRKEEINNIIGKLHDGVGWVDTRSKIDDLLNRHAEEVLKTTERLFHSGGLDLTQYANGNWGLAKVLTTAALLQHSKDFFPMNMGGDKLFEDDLENLLQF